MQVRMAGGMDTMQFDLLLLQQAGDNLGRIIRRHIEGKGNVREFP